MAKLTLSTINSRYSSVAALNANFSAIEEAIENTLSRDGTTPNTLSASLDMNGERILNLPDPVANGEPVPLGWLLEQPDNAASSAVAAAVSATNAAASEDAAEEAASLIVDWEYKGTWATATLYKKNNIVHGTGTYAGWALIALVEHTSSGANVDTDYGAGKWGVLSQRGAAGVGTGDMLRSNNLSDVSSASTSLTNLGFSTFIKTLIDDADAAAARATLDAQQYDADTAKTDVVQTFTAAQRTSETTDNDGSFDLSAALDFKCTPTGSTTLTFTNIPSTPTVQKGTVLWVNGSNYSVAQHANTKISTSDLARLAVSGTYELFYRTSNGLCYVTVSGALV